MLKRIREAVADWRVLCIPFAVLLAVIPLVVRANWRAVHAMTDTTYPEASLVQIGLWAAQSGHLYPSLADPPFTPAPHGPAYYELLRLLATPFPRDFQALAVKARLISLLAFTLMCFELALISQRLGMSRWISAIPALLVFTNAEFYPWAATTRPDVMALLMNATGILLFTWHKDISFKRIMVAGLFAGSAVVFKQSMAAAGLAIAVTCLLYRRWKELAVFCVSAAAIPVAVIASSALQHEPVFEELFLMRYVAKDLHSELWRLADLFSDNPWLVLLVVAGMWGGLIIWKANSLQSRVLVLYCGFAWAIGLTTMLNVGANTNYLLEGWLALAMLAAFAVEEIRRRWGELSEAIRYALLALLLSSTCWQASETFSLKLELSDLDPNVLELVQGKRVFSDVPYVAAHGIDPEFLDAYTSNHLEIRHMWSPISLLDEIQRRRFDLVILYYVGGKLGRPFRGYYCLSSDIQNAIETHYKPQCVLKGDSLLLLVRNDSANAAERNPRIEQACSASSLGTRSDLSILEGTRPIGGPARIRTWDQRIMSPLL